MGKLPGKEQQADRMFDVIVIGGGHAGCEASCASARMGCATLLITSDITKIAHMSCNPSIGGIGKGQIVREIDALGGYTARITDATTLQFRMLNLSKGPAMHSPRAQCDKRLFSKVWIDTLENTPNLYIIQDTAVNILENDGKCNGVKCLYRGDIMASRTILCGGTFLNGLIHIGLKHQPGGRIDEPGVENLSNQLEALGIKRLRFKTGTSARIDARTLDFTQFTEQPGDAEPQHFGYYAEPSPYSCPSGENRTDKTTSENSNPSPTPSLYSAQDATPAPPTLPQLSCYIAYTNPETHRVIEENLDRSPLYQHVIEGRGPRYCPSIEDKIHVFAGKESHPIFIEPENATGYLYYLNGFSSSLPLEVQAEALRTIKGFEHVHIVRPGYAVEYDYFDPTQLLHSLESEVIKSLYLAGQVNGTTGYEEAAAQGLLSGINAALSLQGKPPLTVDRQTAYIGVMIDDLVTKGVDEPYRMFTSRAEHRLHLRQDNADARLMELGYRVGLIPEERLTRMRTKYERIGELVKWLEQTSVNPLEMNGWICTQHSAPLTQQVKAYQIALRPEVKLCALMQQMEMLGKIQSAYEQEVIAGAEIQIKYGRYLEKEREEMQNESRLERISIPSWLNVETLQSVSIEARQKIGRYQPRNLREFACIPGVKVSDVRGLLIAINRKTRGGE